MSDLYPLDMQHDEGSTAVNGRGNLCAIVSTADADKVVVFTYPTPDTGGTLQMTYLSPEGAISLAKALNHAAYSVLNAQVEASA